MRIKNLFLSGCLITGVLLASCSKDNDDELNDQDRDYMIKTSISNSAEISAATLAATKATAPQVKSFAQHMIMEHTLAQNDLKSLGTRVNYAVKDTIDPAHVALAAHLSMFNGRAFDSAYMHTQVVDHQNTISIFQTELNNGRHKDVKNYANTYLPHIQMHHQRADSIANNLFRR